MAYNQDLVLCVVLKDIYFLKKNRDFIVKNLEFDNIYIITAKQNFKTLKFFTEAILIDEDELISGVTFSKISQYLKNRGGVSKPTGWYFQQFLKLGFALSKFAKENYLVWDSDTVPLRPISFHNDGKVLINPKYEHHQPYFKTIDALLDNPPIKADYSFISEHFLFQTKIVKEMIDFIEQSNIEGENWVEKTINVIPTDCVQGFSEFETYGTFCINHHPDLLETRPLRSFRLASRLYGITASKKEIESLSIDFDTASFEIFDKPVSIRRRFKQYLLMQFWKNLNIIRKKYNWFKL